MKTKITLFATVLAAALFLGGCTSTEPAFVSDGLVAYYPFNGNARDASGNGNDGSGEETIALGTDRFGSKDKSYNFNGGYIFVDNHPSLQMSDQLTISAWVKNPEGWNQPVLGKWYQDRKSWSYTLYASASDAGFRLNNGTSNFVELMGWSLKIKISGIIFSRLTMGSMPRFI
jgi:hypothetical protein